MNSIQSLIHKNLNRMLALSLGAAGAALIIYSFFSLKKTESQAIHFVTSHVAALAQAGVNSQNVNEIDKEIARFTQTWKETQDLDLRVDIFLDGKLISHSGQLQPFRFLSSNIEETINLPSGDALRIKVEIGLEKFLIFSGLLLAVFGVFIVAVFRVLNRSMRFSIKNITSPLENEIEWLKTIAQELPISAMKNNAKVSSSGISEIDELGGSINTLLKQIAAQEERIAEINFDRGRLKMAEQVAHSIKGVMATLQLKTNSLTQLSAKERSELSEAINTLRDISANLLREKAKPVTAIEEKKATAAHLLPSIATAVAAKRAQYGRVTINLKNESSLFASFSGLDAGTLQSVFASLIDNSVEAAATLIEVEVLREERTLKIVVSDNGKGIPAKILPLLMKEGATFGKEDGNGIGLLHAREALEGIGGSLALSSEERKGTKVHLSIPLVPAPHGFADRLDIPNGALLVMVDDDPLIHQAVKLKVQSSLSTPVVHLSSVGEFETWLIENGPGELGDRVYLFDYDLKDRSGNGLDLIERHGLTFESVLISGMTGDPEVRARIARLGVRWLPKDFLAQIPFFNLGGTPKAASFLGAV